MKQLSIVIVNYNGKELLGNCLSSIKKHKGSLSLETIVIDNASNDGSPEMVRSKYKWVKLIESKNNLGFAKGNNTAKKYVSGKFILFLNPDTRILKNSLQLAVRYLEKNNDVSVITVKQVLPNGKLDKDSRRSFPTPWVALSHFSGLDRIFSESRLFARYWYGYIDENKTHEIDVAQGSFFMARKNVLDKVGWFDTDYFLNGEDIDLSWKIKKSGKKIMYFPKAEIVHVKKAEKKKVKSKAVILAGMDAMELFYKKRLQKNYSPLITALVLSGIKILKLIRLAKFYTP